MNPLDALQRFFGSSVERGDEPWNAVTRWNGKGPSVDSARLECHRLRAERALVIGRLMFGLAANTPLTNTVIPLSAFKQRHYFENLNAGGAPFCGGGLLQEPS